jgi:hypothetical protein
MLAMVVNADAGHQEPHGVPAFLASMLAPTGNQEIRKSGNQGIRSQFFAHKNKTPTCMRR